MMNILVTGATGFIGSNLCNCLCEKHNVIGIGSTSECNIDPKVKLINCHLTGVKLSYLKNIDLVLHQAANNETQSQDKKEIYEANVYSPIKLIKKLIKYGCKQYIFASSTAIYGNGPIPYEETQKPQPLTLYAKSKLLFEQKLEKLTKDKNIKSIGLRYANVYGSNEQFKKNRSSMIYQLFNEINNNINPTLFKNGEQKRDWIYVNDIVNINLKAIDFLKKMNNGQFELFNAGSGFSVSFNDLVKTISKLLNKKVDVNYIDNPFTSTYQNNTLCSLNKTNKLLFNAS